MKIIAALTTVIVLCASAIAQPQIDGRTCVELAKAVVARDVISLTDRQYTAMTRFALCEASSTSSGATLDVAYKAFSIGATYSDEDKKNICKQSASDLGYNETEYRTAVQYFSQSLPTIDKCLVAASAGWNINYQLVQQDAVSIGISHGAETGGILHGIDIISNSEFSCLGMPGGFPLTILPTKPLTMTCIRKPTKTMLSGLEITSTEDATVNFRFSSGPLPITLKGYSGSVWDRLRSDIQRIDQRVDELNQRTDNFGDSLGRWAGTETAKVSGTQKESCPEGQYVAGIQGIDTDGGRYCTSCISQVQIFCRPLPKP